MAHVLLNLPAMFDSSQIALLSAALGIGFVGSLHCVGMCGPFAALAGSTRGTKGVALYSTGRLFTYATLGVLAGWLGGALSMLRAAGVVVSIGIVLVVSLQLAGLLPEPKLSGRWLAPIMRRINPRSPAGSVALGASTALLPCGLVYAALGVAVTAASPVVGALTMVAFGLGTWPAMLAVGAAAGTALRFGPKLRLAVAVFVATTGMWAIGQRAPEVNAAPDEPPSCCHGPDAPSTP